MESEKKRTQRDYTLAIKLSVVDQVEKGELTYKEARRVTAFKVVQQCWCGCASMVIKIGVVRARRGSQARAL